MPNPVLEAAEILWPITSRGFNEELGFVFFFLANYIPMDMSLNKLWGIVKDREAWSAVVHGVTKSWT